MDLGTPSSTLSTCHNPHASHLNPVANTSFLDRTAASSDVYERSPVARHQRTPSSSFAPV